jgi:hypothetical protein
MGVLHGVDAVVGSVNIQTIQPSQQEAERPLKLTSRCVGHVRHCFVNTKLVKLRRNRVKMVLSSGIDKSMHTGQR